MPRSPVVFAKFRYHVEEVREWHIIQSGEADHTKSEQPYGLPEVPPRMRGGKRPGGVLFVAWGYIDRPNISEYLRITTHVLACTVPTLFVVGVAGVLVLCGGRVGVLGWAGMVLALYGSGSAALANNFDVEPLLYAYFIERGWPQSLIEGLAVMNTGLILVGMATVRTRTLRGLGALALAIGAFGWGYDLSDSAGVALEAAPRSVHVGFGLLFSLGWVVLGLTIWLAAMKQP